MKIYDLVPRDDYRKYLPDYLLDDEIPPEVFSSLQPYLTNQNFSLRDYIGFISGATAHQNIIAETIDRESRDVPNEKTDAYRTWFKTEKVTEIRIFFRQSTRDGEDRTVGSKMRLYSIGKGRNGNQEVQQIDSGFLTTPNAGPPTMVYQRALASTVTYNSLYCIGGPALIRKINIPAKKNDSAPSYKHISCIRNLYDTSLNRDSYTHILNPACRAAGVPDDFFSTSFLDGALNAFTTSRSYEEMLEGFTGLDEEIYLDEMQDIAHASNIPSANPCPEYGKDFDKSPGLNVVETMKQIYDLLN